MQYSSQQIKDSITFFREWKQGEDRNIVDILRNRARIIWAAERWLDHQSHLAQRPCRSLISMLILLTLCLTGCHSVKQQHITPNVLLVPCTTDASDTYTGVYLLSDHPILVFQSLPTDNVITIDKIDPKYYFDQQAPTESLTETDQ